MLGKTIAAMTALGAALAIVATAPAVADGMPSAPQVKKVVKFNPRVHVAYHYVRGQWPGGPDPYAYSYGRPGYYPAFNSDMWVPRKQMLARSKYPLRIPEYYSSWGYPIGCKIHGRSQCGVPFSSPAGDPAHYYRRDVQLPVVHR